MEKLEKIKFLVENFDNDVFEILDNFKKPFTSKEISELLEISKCLNSYSNDLKELTTRAIPALMFKKLQLLTK